MSTLRFMFLILAMSALSSCFPAPYGSYYKPSYPDDDAVLKRRDCGNAVGPMSVLKLLTPDGDISATLKKNRQNQLELRLSLRTSGSSAVQFTSDVFRITDLDQVTEWDIKAIALESLRPLGTRPIPYGEIIDYGRVAPASPEHILKDPRVRIPFAVDNFSPDTVRLHLPAIVIADDRYILPHMTLEADKEKRGYRKGRWDWWPYRWGEEKIGGLAITGAATGGPGVYSWADPGESSPELAGNIFITFPPETRWRFESNSLRFVDAVSGEVRTVGIANLYPEFNTSVSFTAPFCCTIYASAIVPIGEAIPKRLRIEVPSLLINGQEFDIKPITFELRRFDIGVLPFNC